jgi:hypothetical protein
MLTRNEAAILRFMELRRDSIRFVVAEYAHVLAEHGEAFEGAALVQPTGEYFPDEFARDVDSVETLLARILSYTPVAEDLPVSLGFVEGESEGGKGCTSGACSTSSGGGWSRLDGALDEGDGYRVLVHVADTGNPVRLTTALARGAGAVLLAEAGEEPDGDLGARSEIFAVAAGLGVLLLNGSHVFSKGCGGVNVHSGTALSPDELALALALFCAVHGKKKGEAREHLAPTQREAFDAAWAWVASNKRLVAALRTAPETLVDGIFPMEETKGLLGRIFCREETPPPIVDHARAPAKVRSAAEEKRLAEMRALVAEALDGE